MVKQSGAASSAKVQQGYSNVDSLKSKASKRRDVDFDEPMDELQVADTLSNVPYTCGFTIVCIGKRGLDIPGRVHYSEVGWGRTASGTPPAQRSSGSIAHATGVPIPPGNPLSDYPSSPAIYPLPLSARDYNGIYRGRTSTSQITLATARHCTGCSRSS